MGEDSALENAGDIPFHVIFTDLDGTLLDHDTYAWEAAEPALERCKTLKVPVILVSSKTRAEMEVIRQDMSISDPFIVENGGGIFYSEGKFEPPAIGAAPPIGIARPGRGTPQAPGRTGLERGQVSESDHSDHRGPAGAGRRVGRRLARAGVVPAGDPPPDRR